MLRTLLILGENGWVMMTILSLAGLCLLLVEGQRRGFRRRGGRRRGGGRRGRQEVGAGYAAPSDSYSAGDVPVYGQPEYGASDAVPTYAAGDDALAALGDTIPGVPGEDYPIYAEVPETAFSCDGQVDGGKTMLHLCV